jgi:hypothetical protein
MSVTSPITKTARARAESPYMSMTQAGVRLGLDASQMCRMAKLHPLYAPAITGIPGNGQTNLGTRLTRYHVRQVAIIEQVLLGLTDLETGWLAWQVERNRMGGTQTLLRQGSEGPGAERTRRTG